VAYRLRKNESVASGLARVVKRELRAGLEQLASDQPSDEAIHEARKSIKKVRAVLQLLGPHIHARNGLKRLRRASRLLAPLRDADAVVSNARAVCARQQLALSARTCSALRDRLKVKKARLKDRARRDRVNNRAANALKRTKQAAKDWDWNHVDASVLVSEVRRCYKKARRAMRRARDGKQSDTFHTWRKRVKTLWYSLRLLAGRIPLLSRQLTELEHLETWLGDEHNLGVLRAQLARSRGVAGATRVGDLAERRQHALRRRALISGARQFSNSSKEFARRIRRLRRKAA
jgi:hypothetical protein